MGKSLWPLTRIRVYGLIYNSINGTNSQYGAGEETLTLDLFLGKEAL